MGPKKRICIYGHDTFIVGRNSTGHCKTCQANAQSPRNWAYQSILNSDGTRFTTLDFDRAYQMQKGCCALCDKHQTELKCRLAADHDHETRFFRGLVCQQPCNSRIIDVVEKYPDLVEKAKDYIKRGNVSSLL
jgi:hypothetical protein